MKALLYKVTRDEEEMDVIESIEEVDVEHKAGMYAELIGCEMVSYLSIAINGKVIGVFADDEGLMKDNPVVSLIRKDNTALAVGSLLFVSDEEGQDLTTDEINTIKQSRRMVMTDGHELLEPVVAD